MILVEIQLEIQLVGGGLEVRKMPLIYRVILRTLELRVIIVHIIDTKNDGEPEGTRGPGFEPAISRLRDHRFGPLGHT